MDLQAALAELARSLPGTLGVAIRYLPDGPTFVHNADLDFWTASVIKVPIVVEVFAQAAEGRLDLDRRVLLRSEDQVEGSGILQYLGPGLRPSVHDLAERMIGISDNTATNLLIGVVGVAAVNARMRGLGLVRTSLACAIGAPVTPGVADAPLRSRTTPREMLRLFELLWQGALVSPQASQAMLAILEHQQLLDLTRYLPVDDLSEAAGRARSAVRVASKSGAIDGVRNDVGLLTAATPTGPRSFIVSAFSRDVQDDNLWTPENVATRAIGEIGRLAYQHLFSDLV